MYQIALIKKVHTFAKPQIMGWTAELNEEYARTIKNSGLNNANEVLKAKVLQPEQNKAGSEYIDYFELYKKIAVINQKLIELRG